MKLWLDRVGGVLVAPRSSLAAAVRGPAGQGARDVAVLLVLRVIAGETPLLWKALRTLAHGSPRLALLRAFAAAAHVLPDLVGVLIGAMVMSFFVARGAVRERTLDLAAYAWLPYLAVQLTASLVFALADATASEEVGWAVSGVALGWATAVWGLGLWAARQAA